jgi:hypothetical protein
MQASKDQIGVYDNDNSMFGSKAEKYTLVNYPLRTKMSTMRGRQSVGGSTISARETQRNKEHQPGSLLKDLKRL